MNINQNYYNQQPQYQQQPQQFQQPNNNETGHGATFIQAIKLFYNHYLDYQSHSTRSEFWWMKLWELIYMVIFMAIGAMIGVASLTSALSGGAKGAGLMTSILSVGIVGKLLGLVTLGVVTLPLLALRTRRFNDAGLPFVASIGINVARVIFYILSIFAPICGIIFFLLMVASFVIELLPSKNQQQQPNSQQPINNNGMYNPNY